MPEIVMPRLSDTMEEGTVIRWLKREGERVEKGEHLADIETDKATMPLESYESGVIDRLLVREGQTVPIGEPIAIVRSAAEAGAPAPAPARPAPAPTPPAAAPPPAPAPEAPPAAAPPAAEEAPAVKASPLARRIAEEQGVDIRAVKGTGPGGRVTREDVEDYVRGVAARPAPAPAPAAAPAAPRVPEAALEDVKGTEIVKQSRIEATIARRTTQSKTTTPHYYVSSEIDMAQAVRLRREINAAWAPESVSFNDLVVRALALALRAYPLLNASYQDGEIALHRRVNIGIMVAVDNGLLVPVLHDADKKDLRQIAAEAKELIDRARNERSLPGDFIGSTFSISNMGVFPAVDEFFAIINPPESGILAVGAIRQRPIVRDGQLAVSETMKVGLSADHRVYSGAIAAQFLGELKRLLEDPLTLLR